MNNSLKNVMRDHISYVYYEVCSCNTTLTAKELGIGRATMYRYFKTMNIEKRSNYGKMAAKHRSENKVSVPKEQFIITGTGPGTIKF